MLFIDELHTLIGAGSAGDGSVAASNMLKPALARGELHCMGATTLDEYRTHIEKDPALARRFQSVFVAEPSIEDTVSILRGLKERCEMIPRAADGGRGQGRARGGRGVTLQRSHRHLAPQPRPCIMA